MLTKIALVSAFAVALIAPKTAPLAFNMKDPKGVSGLSISIDSPLEPIMGQTSAISGDVKFDPANPQNSTGKIVVDAKELKLTSEAMTGHMLQRASLDVENYPTITFEITKIDEVKETSKGNWDAKVTGNFTLKGTTKAITVNASVSHMPDMLKSRGGVPDKNGDLIVIRCKFSFDRTDFKVGAGSVIGNKVDVTLSAVGYTVK